jgi:hypothetical protein
MLAAVSKIKNTAVTAAAPPSCAAALSGLAAKNRLFSGGTGLRKAGKILCYGSHFSPWHFFHFPYESLFSL